MNYTARYLPLAFFFHACLLLVPVNLLSADQPFENSIVSTDIDFIRSDDPSTTYEILHAGRARKEMPDKRTDVLMADDVFIFKLDYEDGTRVEIWADPDFDDRADAAHYASLVGSALGKLPAALRRKLSHVVVHSGNEVAFSEELGRFFVLYSENMKKRLSEHDLEETIFHETIHATLEAKHASDSAWIQAQKSDPGFMTKYAAEHPKKEDLPESALFAYTLIKHPGRLPKKIEEAIHEVMPNRLKYFRQLFSSLDAVETTRGETGDGGVVTWQENAVAYARIMSRVKWTPVTDGMPMRGGYFEAGTEYTGVPYSSVKWIGRYIGFDIFLKTFLAAVENPHSVLYTENLKGKVSNAECYYGKVCSSYTSYALQCGIWYVSRLHNPPYRDGVALVEPQSAQSVQVGDIIFTPPRPGSHIEIVTGVTRDQDGHVTHVRVEESWPLTTRNTNRGAAGFDSHLATANRKLYRITDLDAWREGNRAERFLFPNYAEDSATPVINRVLLLDRGDWVPYRKGQAVKFNVMDRDAQGVKKLVIKRGDSVVEEIERSGKGVISRTLATCGDYTAHCVMRDGSLSQACEFSVCDLDFKLPGDEVTRGESWDLEFSSDNMNIIIVYFRSHTNSYGQRMVFPSDEDRSSGKVTIPAGMITDKGKAEVWLIGENKNGRLKVRKEFLVE